MWKLLTMANLDADQRCGAWDSRLFVAVPKLLETGFVSQGLHGRDGAWDLAGSRRRRGIAFVIVTDKRLTSQEARGDGHDAVG